MTNIFQQIRQKLMPISLWVFVLSVTMLVIGGGLFIEDTLTSQDGFITVMQHYGLRLTILQITTAFLSLAPQVGQVIFFYVWLTDQKRWWALLASFLLFGIDFGADLYYRVGGQIGFDERTAVAALFTLLAFTLGSELFITFGYGTIIEVADDALDQLEQDVVPLLHRIFGMIFGSIVGLFKADGQRQNTRQNNHRPNTGRGDRGARVERESVPGSRNGDRVPDRPRH